MPAANSSRNSAQSPATNETQYNVRDAALLGAFSAFSKPPLKPKPLVKDYSGGDNGAFLAATKAGTGNPRSSAVQGNGLSLKRDWTGESNQGNLSSLHHSNRSSSSSVLDVPLDSVARTSSPSNIAARLAAARFSPIGPKPSVTSAPARRDLQMEERDIMSPGNLRVEAALDRIDFDRNQDLRKKTSVEEDSIRIIRQKDATDGLQTTDETPIPPTTSLVKMFEQNRPKTPITRPGPTQLSARAPTPVRSPKPQRKIRLSLDNSMGIEAFGKPEKPSRKPAVKQKPLDITVSSERRREDSVPSKGVIKEKSSSPPPENPVKRAVVKPKPPPHKPGRRRESQRSALDLSSTPFLQKALPDSVEDASDDSSSSSYESAPEVQADDKAQPKLPPPRRSTSSAPKSQTDMKPSLRLSPPKGPIESDPMIQVDGKPKPTLPPPRRSTKKPDKLPLVGSSDQPAVAPSHSGPKTSSRSSMTSTPTLLARPSPMSSKTHSSETLYHSNYQRESVRQITKHMTGESLSNAIVGAALASTRTSSPQVESAIQSPPPHRREHHHHYPFHHKRTPSPQKPKHEPGKLRSTMRKEDSSSSEDESEKYKRKGTRVLGMGRKHPNKHHEGTRKRWRDTITERERKRYEGVWAANRGLYLVPNAHDRSVASSTATSPSPARTSHSHSPVGRDDISSEVINLVVKDIWSRSRLPDHALEEIWDLVDNRGVGRLRREEFVVGLWLIDQRLKGRKLPLRVSESVWGSVKGAGLPGIKVRVGGKKLRGEQK